MIGIRNIHTDTSTRKRKRLVDSLNATTTSASTAWNKPSRTTTPGENRSLPRKLVPLSSRLLSSPNSVSSAPFVPYPFSSQGLFQGPGHRMMDTPTLSVHPTPPVSVPLVSFVRAGLLQSAPGHSGYPGTWTPTHSIQTSAHPSAAMVKAETKVPTPSEVRLPLVTQRTFTDTCRCVSEYPTLVSDRAARRTVWRNWVRLPDRSRVFFLFPGIVQPAACVWDDAYLATSTRNDTGVATCLILVPEPSAHAGVGKRLADWKSQAPNIRSSDDHASSMDTDMFLNTDTTSCRARLLAAVTPGHTSIFRPGSTTVQMAKHGADPWSRNLMIHIAQAYGTGFHFCVTWDRVTHGQLNTPSLHGSLASTLCVHHLLRWVVSLLAQGDGYWMGSLACACESPATVNECSVWSHMSTSAKAYGLRVQHVQMLTDLVPDEDNNTRNETMVYFCFYHSKKPLVSVSSRT